MKRSYPILIKDGDLAELIGVTLGDGHICRYSRTEELRIISNSNNPGFINRYARILKKVFKKEPYIIKNNKSNSTKIGLYQKEISIRLGIPTGARGKLTIEVPDWILRKRKYIVRYLRGLYEAEGCICVHKPTYTYKFLFSNKNESILNNVLILLRKLNFHPHRGRYKIQISRKKEVYQLERLLRFRQY